MIMQSKTQMDPLSAFFKQNVKHLMKNEMLKTHIRVGLFKCLKIT